MISVIVLTYNRLRAIKNCLASLESQIEKDFELIVVNTAKEPFPLQGAALECSFPILFQHVPEVRNLAEARERGISKAKGDIIAFLDDDCIATPEWIGRIIEDLKEADAVGGPVLPKDTTIIPRWWDNEMNWLVGLSPPTITGETGGSTIYPQTANMAMTRNVCEEIPFPESEHKKGLWKLTEREDPFVWRRMRLNGFITMIDSHMLVYHDISPDRLRIGYLVRRAFADGFIYYKHEGLDPYLPWAWRDIVSAPIGALGDGREKGRTLIGAVINRTLFAIRQMGFIYSYVNDQPGRIPRLLRCLMIGVKETAGYCADISKALFRTIAIVVYKFLRGKRTLPPNPSTILFVALGYAGDMVLIQPVLSLLKKCFPKTHIELLCSRKELHEGSSLIDGITVFPSAASGSWSRFYAIRKDVRRLDPDVTLVSYHHFLSPFALFFCSNYVIGFDRDEGFHKRFLYDMIDKKIEKDMSRNEIDNLCRLPAALGIDTHPVPRYTIEIPDNARKEANELVSDAGLDSKELILLHPRTFEGYKSWEESNWRTLANMFAEEQHVAAAFIGDDAMREKIDGLLQNDLIHCYNLCGHSLWVFAGLVEAASCLITVDSAPMHLAHALDVPSISLFGGSDERRWGAKWNRERHLIIRACQFDLTGEELLGKPENYQMSLIRPEMVFEMWNSFRKRGYET